MSNKTAEQVRLDYRMGKLAQRKNAKKNIKNVNLPALEVKDLLPDSEGLEQNLIPTESLSNPVKADLTQAWSGGVPAELSVYLNDNHNTPIHSQPFTQMPSFPYEIEVPSSEFSAAGTYTLDYEIVTRGGAEPSAPVTFTVDLEDPNRNLEPFSLVLATDRINADYLAINSGLPFTIPPFVYPRPGDTCKIYMKPPGASTETLVFETPKRPVANFDPLEPTAGLIPADKFVDGNGDPLFNDGVIELSYLAYSRAGNEAKRPPVKPVQMAFLPEPTALKIAVIPLAAETPALIDRADAILGVTIEVPEYENALPGDVIHFRWGAREIGQVTVPALPSFPVESQLVSYPILIAEGDTAGEGPKTVGANYSIARGLLTYDPPGAASTGVDLRTPGPVNPDPGPENPLLGQVTVKGKGPNAEDNKVKPDDSIGPVSVTLPLYTSPTVDDVLEVVWNGTETGYTHTIDGNETEFVIDIPYADVQGYGDGAAVPVQMRLLPGDPNLPPDNIPVTVATAVEVDTFEIGTLAPPTFPEKMRPPFNSLGCDQKIWSGALFKVAGDTVNFAVGDTVTLHWEGHVSEADNTLIPGTEGNQPFVLSSNDVSQGVEHRIAFDPFLKEVADADGILRAWFNLKKGSGSANKDSDTDFVYLSYTKPGGCQCISEGACPTTRPVRK